MFAVAGIAAAWLCAWGGYKLAESAKPTPERFSQYSHSLDLSKLSAEERKRALQGVVDRFDALTTEDRRTLQPDMGLFNQMTEEEKAWYVDATLPPEIRMAFNNFERMPAERRQKLLEDTLAQVMRNAANGNGDPAGQLPISPELLAQVRTNGLKGFYAQSSPEMKARLAPFLNALQFQMQNRRGREP